MQAQMETTAQKYRRLKKEREVLLPVTCPDCDMVWQCRKTDLQFWIASGLIPTSLAAVMVSAVKKGAISQEQILGTLNEKQIIQSIEASSNIVRYVAVEPRIVEHPTEPNDIGYDEVMTCCYNRLRDWGMKGGDEASSLENFRQE